VVLDATNGDRVHAMVFCDARHVRPQFRLEVFRNRLQGVFRAEYDADVVADVRTGFVSSLRDSIHKPHRTRHYRAGLQAVPSLTGLGILSFPFPGTAVPGYRLLRPFATEFMILMLPALLCPSQCVQH
jgi:hypothetical protein